MVVLACDKLDLNRSVFHLFQVVRRHLRLPQMTVDRKQAIENTAKGPSHGFARAINGAVLDKKPSFFNKIVLGPLMPPVSCQAGVSKGF